jgi:hypothetical protein
MSVTNYLITTVTVATGGSASISFSSIPQTYTDLMILISAKTTDANWSYIKIGFNGSTASFADKQLLSDSATSYSQSNNRFVSFVPGTNQGTSVFGAANLYVPNYTSTTSKTYVAEGASPSNGLTGYPSSEGGIWSVSSAITSIELTMNVGNYAEFSSASLYGISKS